MTNNFISLCLASSMLLGAILACCNGTSTRNAPVDGLNVTAAELIRAYKANEVSADERYKDVPLAVSGTVDSIGKDILDNMYVTLKGDEKYEFTSVQCIFSDEHKSALSSLTKGDHVRVVGICKGKLGNILLRECSLRR